MTKWMTSDAVARATCPHCGALPAEKCHTPQGRKVWPPHAGRIRALHNLPDYDAREYQGRAYTLAEISERLDAIIARQQSPSMIKEADRAT